MYYVVMLLRMQKPLFNIASSTQLIKHYSERVIDNTVILFTLFELVFLLLFQQYYLTGAEITLHG